MDASIQHRVSVTRNVTLLSRVAHAHYALIFASVSYDIVSVRQARQDAEVGLINCGDRSGRLRRQVGQFAEAGSMGWGVELVGVKRWWGWVKFGKLN